MRDQGDFMVQDFKLLSTSSVVVFTSKAVTVIFRLVVLGEVALGGGQHLWSATLYPWTGGGGGPVSFSWEMPWYSVPT